LPPSFEAFGESAKPKRKKAGPNARPKERVSPSPKVSSKQADPALSSPAAVVIAALSKTHNLDDLLKKLLVVFPHRDPQRRITWEQVMSRRKVPTKDRWKKVVIAVYHPDKNRNPPDWNLMCTEIVQYINGRFS
jgi:hypothetical protein